MPIISGPVERCWSPLALVALLVWLRRDRRTRGPGSMAGGIDREELEAGRAGGAGPGGFARPDEDRRGDDWGPGVARPGGVPKLRP